MINLRQLETFYWAAKLGSFTAVSEGMRITQSAVSIRINELEAHLRQELFKRGRRAPTLTAKGRDLLHYAERVLRLCAEAEASITGASVAPDVLRIGFAEVISMTWL